MTSGAPQQPVIERRGYRPAPTPRHREHIAMVAIARALSTGDREHRVTLPGGTLAARAYGPGHWRLAMTNHAGRRVALAVQHGDRTAHGAVRAFAEVFAPARRGRSGRAAGWACRAAGVMS